jgi:ABC-type antimicrobial peptide transport system permease subunit
VIEFAAQNYEIVGVTANALFTDLKQNPPPTIYFPYEQYFAGGAGLQLNFAVRTAGPPESFVPSLQSIIHELDPRLPLIDVETQQHVIDGRLRNESLFANLSTVFGLLALLLASIGIYGVVAYSVTRRTGEVGIRMALGAQGSNIVWLMLRRIAILVALGVAVGIGGALALTRWIESMLWNVTPDDPITIAATVVLLVLIALFAGLIPARRAARIHPMEALRSE